MSYQAADGRWYTDRDVSDYHGFQSWRDCFINVVDGSTDQQGMWYLEGLCEYAMNHVQEGKPIMPPGVNVWISVDGYTTSVQADDVTISQEGFSIGGIKFDGEDWDFSEAGKSGGGGSGWITVDVHEENDPETGDWRFITNFETAEPVVRAMPFVCFVFHLYDLETGDPLPLEYWWPSSLSYVDDESPVLITASDGMYAFEAQNIHSRLVGYRP